MKFPKECDNLEKVIVTRHTGLSAHLIESGIVPEGTKVYAHVTPDMIKGKHVIGILPFDMASHCEVFTEIPLRIPANKKGLLLTGEDMRFYIQEPRTYIVKSLT